MTPIKTLQEDGSVIWQAPGVFAHLEPRMFDPVWLRKSGALTGSSIGRHEAHFLRLDGRDMVLRHYHRGGLIGRINKDLFLRQPVGKSRAMREFHLLQWMHDQGLPVPLPYACRFVPSGLFYRTDLMMERIMDTRTLAEALRAAPLPQQTWHRIGAVVARLHGLGVDHTDLNCRNILLDAAGQVWLIDFDKCHRRAAGNWTGGNLLRLKRSLEKERRNWPSLHYGDADWWAFQSGYDAERS